MIKSIRLTTVLLTTFALLAAACGSDGGDDDIATDDTATAEADDAAAGQCEDQYDETVRIGWTPLLSFLPVHYALTAGYYEEAGLTDVQFVEFQGGSPAAAAMVSGSIEFITTSGERPLLLAEAGEEVKNVQAINSGSDMAVIAREGTGIEPGSIESLRGKAIGITAPGGGFDKTLRLLLQTAGLDPDSDLSIVALGGTPNAIAGMETGAVDAVVFGEPVLSQLLQNDEFFTALSIREDYPEVGRLGFSGLQTTAGYIEENPCIVEKVVQAASRATNELAADVPDAAVQDAVTVFGGGMSEEVLAAALDGTAETYSPVITDEMAQDSIEAMVAEGSIPEGTYTPQDLYTDRFAEAWEEGT